MTARWLGALLVPPLAYAGMTLALAGANRGTARAPMVLTQREAEAPFRNDENSATRLRLAWLPALPAPLAWFNRDKLRELGFDVSVAPAAADAARHYRRMLPREAFVAFEYDGPAWQAWLTARREAEPVEAPRPLGDYASRLVAVDAARDAATLAGRYPDGRTHLITAAVVRLELVSVTGEMPYLAGNITNIDPGQVYVPRDLARQLPLPDRGGEPPPAYEVTLGYGARWEPFVLSISRAAASR